MDIWENLFWSIPPPHPNIKTKDRLTSEAAQRSEADVTSCYMAFLFTEAPRKMGLPGHSVLPAVWWCIWNGPFLGVSNEWHLEGVLLFLEPKDTEVSFILTFPGPVLSVYMAQILSKSLNSISTLMISLLKCKLPWVIPGSFFTQRSSLATEQLSCNPCCVRCIIL